MRPGAQKPTKKGHFIDNESVCTSLKIFNLTIQDCVSNETNHLTNQDCVSDETHQDIVSS